MVNLSIFAERLSEIMFDKKTKPEALAKILGVDLSLIYKYLRKENLPSTPNAIRIANYFNCSLDYLIGLSEDLFVNVNTENKPFAICFQELLKQHNCTRYQLKKDTVIAKQSVDDWYNGVRVPTIDNLLVLAEYFNCSLDNIVCRDN